MFDRFDDARDEAMQTTLTNEQFDFASSGMVDLDLGSPADAPRLIQSLAPSEGAASAGRDSVAGLTLDLSTGEALPAAAGRPRRGSGVDLEVGADAALAAASRRATSTSRSSARCASAFRSSTSTSTRPTSCRAA